MLLQLAFKDIFLSVSLDHLTDFRRAMYLRREDSLVIQTV